MGKKLIGSLGEVMQLAFVPSDLDAALNHWLNRMGVGPFFRLEHAQRRSNSAHYRGFRS
jgi:methylmalonyl-CoA/ethylmalonyl-CoA epimerase